MLKIATWNVNSLRARLGRVEQWVRANAPDVLCLQETKCSAANFPAAAFEALGYESAHHGNNHWNGVAVLSRVGLESVQAGFSVVEPGIDEECRYLAATTAGVRVVSVYVPNGRIVDSEHYVAKLEWLAHLRAELDRSYRPEEAIAVCGDFNVAPEDRDVWDITQFAGMTHVTAPERAALAEVMAFGLHDAFRRQHPDEVGPFSWWDYRAGSFHRGWGMRIDLTLVSASLLATVRAAEIDREARKGPQPSDHAPVVLTFEI